MTGELFEIKGDQFKVDGITLCCLSPDGKCATDKNRGSLVLQVSFGNFDLLLTGDIDQTVEQQLEWTRKVEILKVAHHGSASSSGEKFLRKLRPDQACISVGKKNSYGLPAEEALKRLRAYCGRIWMTNEDGAILVETDGKGYKISSFRSKAMR